VLRLTHPKTRDLRLEAVWKFMLNGTPDEGDISRARDPRYMEAQASPDPHVTATLVRQFGLPREALKPSI